MEPKKAVSLVDLLTHLGWLRSWKKTTFQKFLESGFHRDILELVTMPGFQYDEKIFSTVRNLIGETDRNYDDSDPISVKQVFKLFEVVDLNNGISFRKFLFLVGHHGLSSEWWRNNKLTWELRDEWREKLGLNRINPIHNNVIFMRIYNNTMLGDFYPKPPKGFRYAVIDEWDTVGRPKDLSVVFSAVVATTLEWFIARQSNRIDVLEKTPLFNIIGTFYLPLVRVE